MAYLLDKETLKVYEVTQEIANIATDEAYFIKIFTMRNPDLPIEDIKFFCFWAPFGIISHKYLKEKRFKIINTLAAQILYK
jgi:hypothetical protein